MNINIHRHHRHSNRHHNDIYHRYNIKTILGNNLDKVIIIMDIMDHGAYKFQHYGQPDSHYHGIDEHPHGHHNSLQHDHGNQHIHQVHSRACLRPKVIKI